MGSDDINEKPGTPIAKFFSKFTRKRPSRTNSKVSDDNKDGVHVDKPGKAVESSPSRFGTFFSRSRARSNQVPRDDDVSVDSSTWKDPSAVFKTSTPRSAKSENDLRFVNVQRGSCVPQTPLAGVTHFQSQNDLASASIGTPLEKVPSYVKISCTLNGYGTPRKAQNGLTSNPMILGKSLVERRLLQYRENPAVFDTPPASRVIGNSASSDATKNMGANGSVMTPVSGLIEKFNRICLDDKPQTAEIKPHMILIDTQPHDQNFSQKSDVLAAMENKSDDYEASKCNTVVQAADSTTQDEQDILTARSGSSFQGVLSDTRSELEKLCDKASEDLETVENMPEEAADAIRMAVGKAKLLIRKKIGKFESLVNVNLGIETADRYATNEDLEGYWSLVEIELSDIHSFFQTGTCNFGQVFNLIPPVTFKRKFFFDRILFHLWTSLFTLQVDNYRNRGWKMMEKENIEQCSLKDSSISTKIAPRKFAPSTTVKTEDQKRKAEETTARRKAMIEQAKAKARMLQSTAEKPAGDSFMQIF